MRNLFSKGNQYRENDKAFLFINCIHFYFSAYLKSLYRRSFRTVHIMLTDDDEVPHAQSRFMQQALPACKPLYTPCASSALFLCVAAVSFVLGALILKSDRGIVEASARYDNACALGSDCTVNLSFGGDVSGAELFVYIELRGLYQNSFMYGSSKSWAQFKGDYVAADSLSKCDPMRRDSAGNPFAPCGTLPMTALNDTLVNSGALPNVTARDISVSSFRSLFSATNANYSNSSAWMSAYEEVFPDGQRDERFVNWVQISPLRTFRKLWGRTGRAVTLPRGTYAITIRNQYPVAAFGGEKHIVVSSVAWTGGKNVFLGALYLALGAAAAIIAAALAIAYFVGSFPIYKFIANCGADTSLCTL